MGQRKTADDRIRILSIMNDFVSSKLCPLQKVMCIHATRRTNCGWAHAMLLTIPPIFSLTLKWLQSKKNKNKKNKKKLVNTGADCQKNLKHHLEPWKSAPSKNVSGTTALKGRTLTVWLACCTQVLIDLCEVWHMEITSHRLYFPHTTMSTNSFHWQTVYTAKWPWTLPLSPY